MTFVVVVLIVVVIAVVVLGLLRWQRKHRSDQLKSQFGSEYDRTVSERGDRQAAEQDLSRRQERRSTLELRNLDAVQRQQYTSSWQQVQTQFVDDPPGAVGEAYRLVRQVMAARGYPTDDFEQQADDVSVDHPELVADYRAAVRVTEASDEGTASTEDLREAMVHYRALFTELLEKQEQEGEEER